MGKIFALDIGVASVGSAVVDAESYEVIEATSNIFEEATAAENVVRREMRESRRGKRRKKTRILDYVKLWTNSGFSIPVENENDILGLRNKGLDEKITNDELFCVLRYMLEHRGISYLDDGDDGKSGSDYAKAVEINRTELKDKYPCQIQLERMNKYGQFRGNMSVEENDELIHMNNVFTNSSYRKEIEVILNKQKEFDDRITDEFIAGYLTIFNRKREYYIGPGNEKSRTDYGIYTCNKDEEGHYITENNIFDKLIGKCSIYPEEFRAAGASYTAQEFNVLNDLNNLTINGRKLEKDEKEKIIEIVKDSKTVNMKTIIKKVIGESIEQFSGARIDKNEKEIFHKFDVYRGLKSIFAEENVDIDSISREQLDDMAKILTLNTEREVIEKEFKEKQYIFSDELFDKIIQYRKKNGSLFNKWQSFSVKIMLELIPNMYAESKEQMQLLTEMGVFKSKGEKYKNYKYIPIDSVIEEIYNPVVERSIRTSIKVLNEYIKKYGYPEQIVIEMPRDRNSDEQKDRIRKEQRKNENELNEIFKLTDGYGIEITKDDYKKNKNLGLKLKLWNEQSGRCLYSGKTIKIEELLDKPYLFEIDHIIPKSISFDDSRNNKVLVYATENQEKGNRTPYMYLNSISREWDFDEFMSYTLMLGKEKKISSKKVSNLLFSEDITKIDVLKGFINRNLNDTRYASRVVLNELQSFFKNKEECDTKIKVIRGSFTHQMRKNMRLEKNREESYAHHAIDAMLIAYSQLGYDAYRKIQEEVINFEEDDNITTDVYESMFDDEYYDNVVYQKKWGTIKENITDAESKVKYHFRVDKKCNRALCNQTIYGTRIKEDEVYKIQSFNIYDNKDCASLIKLINSNKCEDLLLYKNDPKTYQDMLKILKEYDGEANPFVAYHEETGDYFRKYSKKHNGPIIRKLKYYKEKVGSCIDISHKFGHEKGSKKVILGSLKPYRTDVYYNPQKEQYYLVGLKYNHIKCENGHYVIDSESYMKLLVNAGILKENQKYDELIDLGYEYKFSLYKNDIIRYKIADEDYEYRFLARNDEKRRNNIEVNPVNSAKFEPRKKTTLTKSIKIEKIVTDMLGNPYRVEKEKFSFVIDK